MNFWLLITELGDEKAYLVFVPFVYFVVDRRTGWQLFCALILSSLTVITLKNFFKLPRPPKYLWKTSVSGYGFPSGHTTVSATFWSYLAFKIRKVWFFAVAFVVVGLVGLSRIFLGVHYVRDVIGGLIIGISIGYAASSIEFSLNRSSKLLGIVISSLLIFSLYPLIGHYAFKIGGYLLGFGVAHTLSTDYLNYGLPDSLKLRFVMFIIGLSILLFGSIINRPIVYPISGFFGCIIPNCIGWRFRNEERIEHSRIGSERWGWNPRRR